jgi:hypothetical protein
MRMSPYQVAVSHPDSQTHRWEGPQEESEGKDEGSRESQVLIYLSRRFTLM